LSSFNLFKILKKIKIKDFSFKAIRRKN